MRLPPKTEQKLVDVHTGNFFSADCNAINLRDGFQSQYTRTGAASTLTVPAYETGGRGATTLLSFDVTVGVDSASNITVRVTTEMTALEAFNTSCIGGVF